MKTVNDKNNFYVPGFIATPMFTKLGGKFFEINDRYQ